MARGPITWRNITAPDNASSLAAMQSAQQSIGNAFDGLRQAFTDFQNARVERGTEDYLDALYSQYKTPDKLAAAIESGEINQLREQFGNRLDRRVAREAPANLLSQMLQQGTERAQYEDLMDARNQRGVITDMYRMASQGNFDGAMALLDSLDKALVNPDAIANAQGIYHAGKQDSRADTQLNEMLHHNAFNRGIAQRNQNLKELELAHKLQQAQQAQAKTAAQEQALGNALEAIDAIRKNSELAPETKARMEDGIYQNMMKEHGYDLATKLLAATSVGYSPATTNLQAQLLQASIDAEAREREDFYKRTARSVGGWDPITSAADITDIVKTHVLEKHAQPHLLTAVSKAVANRPTIMIDGEEVEVPLTKGIIIKSIQDAADSMGTKWYKPDAWSASDGAKAFEKALHKNIREQNYLDDYKRHLWYVTNPVSTDR